MFVFKSILIRVKQSAGACNTSHALLYLRYKGFCYISTGLKLSICVLDSSYWSQTVGFNSFVLKCLNKTSASFILCGKSLLVIGHIVLHDIW